jgi:hypothetical protein
MDNLAFKVNGALLNQWGRIQFTVRYLKNLGFIDFMTGIDSAAIHFCGPAG